MTRSTAVLLLAGVLLGASGCAVGTQHFGRVIDARKIAGVRIGESNKQDVLDLFGPPTQYSSAYYELNQPTRDDLLVEVKEAEDVFTYEYREENERFFTVLLYTHFWRDTIADTLMVFFDDRDVVKYLSFAKQTDAQPGAAPGGASE